MAPGSVARKYLCSGCSRSYAKAEHLTRHQRVHTGVKPFQCPNCARKFARQDSLTRHQHRYDHFLPAEDLPRRNVAGRPNRPSSRQEQVSQQDSSIFHQSILHNLAVTPLLQADTANAGSTPTPLNQCDVGDMYMQLTWPESEDLLQSILSSNLAPLQGEIFPYQDNAGNTPQISAEQHNSPWLTQDTQLQSGSTVVSSVSQIISDLSITVTSEAISTGLSPIFLDGCLHMFFEQFIPWFPVCHRSTFVFREWTHPLLLNAIALGSLFSPQEANLSKGEALWKLAHTAVATSWHSLILHRGPHDPCNGVQLILTALLGQTYAMLSGNTRLRTTAQVFHSLGFHWAHECNMYSSSVRKFDPTCALQEHDRTKQITNWRVWAAEEVQMRAVLGHYLLDGQLTQFTGAPTQRHASNSLPVPCSEELFHATTVEEWMKMLELEPKQNTTFRQLFLSLFADAPYLQPKLSLLAIKVLMEGLRSFVSETNATGEVVGSPSNPATSRALAYLYTYICTNFTEPEKIELLLRWHSICLDAASDSTNLYWNLCTKYAVEEAASREDRVTRQIDLRSWVLSQDARLALLHATAIWDLLNQLPLGRSYSVHVPTSSFSAAMVYCAFVLAGESTTTVPRDLDWGALAVDSTREFQSLQKVLSPHQSSSAAGSQINVRNLLYDCTMFLLHLRQTAQVWRFSARLESLVQKWLTHCGS